VREEMKITPEIVRHELMGVKTEVGKSTHAGYVGLSGKIVNETRNTFTILDSGKRKTIVKNLAFFHFSFDDGTVVEVDGRLLTGRPEDRLKKTIRRLW
jgi:ribonuclease P protein subunit POP4